MKLYYVTHIRLIEAREEYSELTAKRYLLELLDDPRGQFFEDEASAMRYVRMIPTFFTKAAYGESTAITPVEEWDMGESPGVKLWEYHDNKEDWFIQLHYLEIYS